MSAPMEVSVLLGLCDEIVKESSQTTWSCNKIGGHPDLMFPQHFKHPKCALCGCDLAFATQIYCPLENQSFHRTLYMFACVRKQCWNRHQSWTVLRSQQPTELPNQTRTDKQKPQETVTMETNEWCDDADDWGADDVDGDDWNIETYKNTADTQEPTKTQGILQGASSSSESDLESAKLSQRLMGLDLQSDNNDSVHVHSEQHQTKSIHFSDLMTFQSYFVNVFDEPQLTDIFVTAHEQKLMKDYEKREGLDFREWQHESGGATGRKKGGAETYEKADVKHGDKFFHKFSKRIAQYPEQCIRYSWNGSPLYITSPDKINHSIPCCENCGSARVFELQLMPGLVSYLKVPQHEETSVEFGVVLVYSCRESCWNSTDVQYRVEHVVVQADPDNDLLNSKEKGPLHSKSVAS